MLGQHDAAEGARAQRLQAVEVVQRGSVLSEGRGRKENDGKDKKAIIIIERKKKNVLILIVNYYWAYSILRVTCIFKTVLTLINMLVIVSFLFVGKVRSNDTKKANPSFPLLSLQFKDPLVIKPWEINRVKGLLRFVVVLACVCVSVSP